ncbi:MAG: helix-turn-helix transcriptional regulator [Enterocloster sp.]
MSEISKEIGQNIRRTRKMRKITHQQLAQAIGKSQSAISKYESGEIAVDIDTLYAIANALQVHIETLLYFPNTATSSSTLKECPAFFRNVKNLYGYVYDGRINRIGRRLLNSIRKKMALRRS